MSPISIQNQATSRRGNSLAFNPKPRYSPTKTPSTPPVSATHTHKQTQDYYDLNHETSSDEQSTKISLQNLEIAHSSRKLQSKYSSATIPVLQLPPLEIKSSPIDLEHPTISPTLANPPFSLTPSRSSSSVSTSSATLFQHTPGMQEPPLRLSGSSFENFPSGALPIDPSSTTTTINLDQAGLDTNPFRSPFSSFTKPPPAEAIKAVSTTGTSKMLPARNHSGTKPPPAFIDVEKANRPFRTDYVTKVPVSQNNDQQAKPSPRPLNRARHSITIKADDVFSPRISSVATNPARASSHDLLKEPTPKYPSPHNKVFEKSIQVKTPNINSMQSLGPHHSSAPHGHGSKAPISQISFSDKDRKVDRNDARSSNDALWGFVQQHPELQASNPLRSIYKLKDTAIVKQRNSKSSSEYVNRMRREFARFLPFFKILFSFC